jgi:phosphoglycerate dehydrogenase-like enzyme
MTVVLCGVPQVLDRLRAEFPDVDVVDLSQYEGPTPPDAVLFLGFNDASAKAARDGVAWIQLAGTGVDQLKPEDHRAPVITCAKGAGAVPIAEYVLSAMLAASRRYPDTWLREPPEMWNFQRTMCLTGQQLGLVGFGGIGQRVAVLARAFDMRVVAYRRTPRASEIDGVQIATTLAEVLADSDHVVLCLPATRATTNLFNDEVFAQMKAGVHLVNIARGAIIDQDALRRALDDGPVARATLDVCVPEPLPAGHWLYSHEKVFLTPHSSWTGIPFLTGAVNVFCENLRRYLAGEELIGVVDFERGY